MKVVLALEASSGTYTVAVGAGERPRTKLSTHRGDPGFAGLGELAARTLATAGVTFGDLGVIAVDVGPGSLSAVRAAVAYANGLAFGLGAPVFPLSSLELMAMEAAAAHGGPFLCLSRAAGEDAYAGLITNGEVSDMRYGQRSRIVPAMAGDLGEVCVAGAYRDEVARLLPGVTVQDTGVSSPDVDILFEAARVAAAGGQRLVPVTSPLNEGSTIFHRLAPSQRP